MKVCIVGAAGQVGRGLMQALRNQPDVAVFGITRNAMSAAPLLADGMEIRVGAVADAAAAGGLLRGADVVVNCALEIDRPKRARLRNEHLMSTLLAEAHASLVIHLSSIAVYGSCVDSSVSTFDRPRPDSTYGREKLHLEGFAQKEASRRGQPLLTLRLGHVYGPGEGVSREVFDVLRERRWDLPFGGQLASNAVHINHLATAIPLLAASGRVERVLNATDSPQRTWRCLYEMHGAAARCPLVPSVPEPESLRRRDELRRMARMPLVARVPKQVTAWMRQLPLKSLVNVTAVRQAVEATLLGLPIGVEQMIDRRYAVFSAGHNLNAEPASGTEGAPPWYYSDAVSGPNLPAHPETDAQTADEIASLRRWHAQWAMPSWRTGPTTSELS